MPTSVNLLARQLPRAAGPVLLLFATCIPAVAAEFNLENPQPNGYESGIGIVSGFHCSAEAITLTFDCDQDHPVCRDVFTAGSGTYRGDTAGVCGDTDNGFAFLVNFNNMGTGRKTVHAYADGVEFASADFTVTHFGQSFISGLRSYTEVTVPELEKSAMLTWQQSKQSYVITQVEDQDFSFDQLIAAVSRTWSGRWESTDGNGYLTLSIGVTGSGDDRRLIPTDVALSGTGCAAVFVSASPIDSLDFPMTEVNFSDGSQVQIEILSSDSLSSLVGTFVFESGPCSDKEGAFILYNQ